MVDVRSGPAGVTPASAQTSGGTPKPAAVAVPRRSRIDLMSKGELAIRDALIAVEAMGAHPMLTAVVNELSTAQGHLANYVDMKLTEVEALGLPTAALER